MKKLFLSICMLLFAGSALAEDRAWTTSRQRLEYKRDASSFVALYDDGELVFSSRYSNGRRIAGIHYRSELFAYSSTGKLLFFGQQGAGLNASHGGGTVVVHVKKSKKIDPTIAKQIVRMTVGHRLVIENRDFASFIVNVSKPNDGEVGPGLPNFSFDPEIGPLPAQYVDMIPTTAPKRIPMRTQPKLSILTFEQFLRGDEEP